MDIAVLNRSVSGLWYREIESGDRTLARFERDIYNNFIGCGCGFKPKCALIVTWERVNSYCAVWFYYQGRRSTDEMFEDGPVDPVYTCKAIVINSTNKIAVID